MQPTAPRWSPDSTRIAFFDASSGKPFQLFLVPANGGSALSVVEEPWNEIDPNWSPDGHMLVFSHFPVFDRQADLGIYSFDLVTHKLAKLPGSDGLWTPRWSPDGSFILGRSADSLSLLLFDVHAQTWHQLARGESFGYANSSPGCPASFVDFTATTAGSDFSRPCIIGFGSSPSPCGPVQF